jgi:hypothetical protein
MGETKDRGNPPIAQSKQKGEESDEEEGKKEKPRRGREKFIKLSIYKIYLILIQFFLYRLMDFLIDHIINF